VKVLLAAYVAVTAWRWHCPEWDQAYYRFDMHMSGLILGCALAGMPRWNMPAWPGLVLLGGLFLALIPGEPFTQGPGIMLTELGTALLIMARTPAWLGVAPLAYIGRISYGIYLWHYPVAAFVVRVYDWPEALLITLAISVPMAALSYHTVEAWFRSVRRVELLQPQPDQADCNAA
jgi:peptidoglycan/LPS O-acetylase OafA/YrhL